jgi:predicted signal transduction protein with EAL and GGDEF domain
MHSTAWLRMRSVRLGCVFVLEYPSSLPISILLSHCSGLHVAGAVAFFSQGFSSVYKAIIIDVCIVSTLSVLCLLSDYNRILLLFSQCLSRLKD